ncbi:putative leucine-rich repeat receptor-like protein kinase At2g19210 [Syzygium oleosum]|uniref:putative leucine-rich repeat receptor-like protein kinase At2g19210 n=1 Tax=Syzygium oleosum TaxID=219896 RepID=UPI0024BAAA78|nr:putative leucine-rich repeat receptor-like protein kinase At2g19210 [Syzygium oleosum]
MASQRVENGEMELSGFIEMTALGFDRDTVPLARIVSESPGRSRVEVIKEEELRDFGVGEEDKERGDKGFISIDCGAPNSYPDDKNGIYYEPDAGFVDSGTDMQVSTQVIDILYEHQSKNLRAFPNGTRNCYTLTPDKGKGNTYLVRADFWYGNYDGKNQTPAFDLHIDVNYWTTVNSSSWIYKEIIYTPPRDYIQVCLVNTGLGIPFISALELRLLDNSTYQINSGALVSNGRYNLGSINTYRHPEDVYDRIWAGQTYSKLLSVSNTTAIVTSTSNDAYKVPPEVLMTATQVQNVADPLSLSWTSNNSTTVWYIYFHFVELQLQDNDIREFTVNVQEFTETVKLENLKPVTVASSPIAGLSLDMTIGATARSTLPPLLNAVELFIEAQLKNSPTVLDDFNAMYDVKKTYGVIRASWQGDPCVPIQHSWSGLHCSYDSSPRIVSLNLSSSGLKGLLATSISNLKSVVSLDLSDNSLTGSIPDVLAQMPNLKVLNLARNNLNGYVPQTLLKKKADGSLLLSIDGNPNLCQSDNCQTSNVQPKKKGISIAPIIASIAAVLVLIFFGVLAVLWIIKRRQIQNVTTTTMPTNSTRGSTGTSRLSKNRTFTSTEVTRITDNFRTVIGEGGFGRVYFGRLDDGTEVAVKMLSHSSKQGSKEFHTEAQLLMVVHHRNLVSLIGYCEEFENMALIYEFMFNGNVQQHLSATQNPNVLSWSQRLQIAIDAAQGLEYLHNGCKPPIVHRDLKTPNILLNKDMQAKIADFGLSKAFVTEHDSHITTRPSGTPGYLDPEFQTSGNLSKKSDVYSFGVILFELITGHPAIIRSPEGSTHIVHWVTPLIERGDIQSIVDPRLNGQFNIGSAWNAVEIAMSCVPTTAVQRPDINRVLLELKECLTAGIGSGRSQRMGNSKRSESFETSSLDVDIAPSAR